MMRARDLISYAALVLIWLAVILFGLGLLALKLTYG